MITAQNQCSSSFSRRLFQHGDLSEQPQQGNISIHHSSRHATPNRATYQFPGSKRPAPGLIIVRVNVVFAPFSASRQRLGRRQRSRVIVLQILGRIIPGGTAATLGSILPFSCTHGRSGQHGKVILGGLTARDGRQIVVASRSRHN